MFIFYLFSRLQRSKPPPEGGSQFFLNDTSDDPFPAGYDDLLGQMKVRELFLHFSGQEESCWRKVRGVKGRESPGANSVLDHIDGVDERIVQVEKPLAFRHFRVPLPHMC
jgi:hypothetical protein